MQHKMSRRLICILFTVLVLSGTLTGSFSGTKNIISTVSAADPDYKSWKQFDTRWNCTPVGNSTLGAIGCLVTSLAILAVHSGTVTDDSFNPGTFTKKLAAAGGFSSYGMLYWTPIPKAAPGMSVYGNYRFTSSTKAGKAAEMQWWIDRGYYIICHCKDYYDAQGKYNSHFVAIEGTAGDRVYMMDPGSWGVSMFDTYYYGYATEYMVIKGVNPPPAFEVPGASIEITINSLPDKTVYNIGESLDLTGGEAVVTGTGYNAEPWVLKPEAMGRAQSFSTDVSEFDSSKAGVYNIYLYATRDGVEETISFPITVTEPDAVINAPAAATAAETAELATTAATSAITTTSTTTTTTASSTTTTTTATASTTATVFTTENSPGEYYCETDNAVYSLPDSESNIIGDINEGYIVNIKEINGNYGYIWSDGIKGWIDMSILTNTVPSEKYAKGDINNDGTVDLYDLSLLNEYLKSIEESPKGISAFTAAELEAADINSDGCTDDIDILEYLSIILK